MAALRQLMLVSLQRQGCWIRYLLLQWVKKTHIPILFLADITTSVWYTLAMPRILSKVRFITSEFSPEWWVSATPSATIMLNRLCLRCDIVLWITWYENISWLIAPDQWEMVLLCSDVSHWLGADLAPGNATLWRRVPVTTTEKSFGWSDQV